MQPTKGLYRHDVGLDLPDHVSRQKATLAHAFEGLRVCDDSIRVNAQTIDVSALITTRTRLASKAHTDLIQLLVALGRPHIMCVDRARTATFGTGASLSLCGVDDVEEDSLQVVLVVIIEMVGASGVWVDLHLDLLLVTLFSLAIHLIVHSEERKDRDHIGYDKVNALDQLKEAWVFVAELYEL